MSGTVLTRYALVQFSRTIEKKVQEILAILSEGEVPPSTTHRVLPIFTGTYLHELGLRGFSLSPDDMLLLKFARKGSELGRTEVLLDSTGYLIYCHVWLPKNTDELFWQCEEAGEVTSIEWTNRAGEVTEELERGYSNGEQILTRCLDLLVRYLQRS
jgi:hypothetical protein